jgi:hypothetical protein
MNDINIACILGVLTILLTTLKLTGYVVWGYVVVWSWWLILSPLLFGVVVVCVFFSILYIAKIRF